MGDAAYDTVAIYDQAGFRGARVIAPPKHSATVPGGKPRSVERDQTTRRVAKTGRAPLPLLARLVNAGELRTQPALCTNALALDRSGFRPKLGSEICGKSR